MTDQAPTERVDTKLLREIERRVLWLAMRMIDHANRGRATPPVGHQASAASTVSVLTALWFGHLAVDDRIGIPPDAAPVHHALRYLSGDLRRSDLETLGSLGGLQVQPSRPLDPDGVDFSTGAVGPGAVAPVFAAAVRRYVDQRFGDRPESRFVSVIGDDDLDLGDIWEAIADPVCAGLGRVMLVVDLNRQGLDRVVPDARATRLKRFFSDSGWHVVEAKYGHRLQAAFARPRGDALRYHFDSMANEDYQELFSLPITDLRERFLFGAQPEVVDLLEPYDDQALADLVFNLGGHDMDALIDCFQACDAEKYRPSVVFAYTVKGWSLPTAGAPDNHSALLRRADIDRLRVESGLTEETEWDRFDDDTPAGRLCLAKGAGSAPPPPAEAHRSRIPVTAAPARIVRTGEVSTEDAFGQVLGRLTSMPYVAERLVTVSSPELTTSPALAPVVGRTGVFAPATARSTVRPPGVASEPTESGGHVALGVSESNLHLLLGQLGLGSPHHGETLLPVGVVPDSRLTRGLDALVVSLHDGSRFVVAGSGSGLTGGEGALRSSFLTPSLTNELPGLGYCEPAFATETQWLVCDALDRLTATGGESTYIRLSPQPVDQEPFASILDRMGERPLRDLVVAGGYRLIEPAPAGGPGVVIVATGSAVAEAVAASDVLEDEGVAATVINLTAPGRVHRSWRDGLTDSVGRGRASGHAGRLERLLTPAERDLPVVTAHDAASSALGWIGSALGSHQIPLGADRFAQSGRPADLRGLVGISRDHIVNAALVAITPG